MCLIFVASSFRRKFFTMNFSKLRYYINPSMTHLSFDKQVPYMLYPVSFTCSYSYVMNSTKQSNSGIILFVHRMVIQKELHDFIYCARFASANLLKLCEIYQPVSFNTSYLDIYTDGLTYA